MRSRATISTVDGLAPSRETEDLPTPGRPGFLCFNMTSPQTSPVAWMLYRRVSLLCFPGTNSDLGYRDLGDAYAGDLWVCWPCLLSRVPPSPHRAVGEDPSPLHLPL